ncbi:2'-5' RNA ligase superfamily protein [Rhizobiales bacterium GAS113]|jgi:2'-5' RNA ligase|nr:2'-5' RNA ligase superfamily protein [Rhizobiales bacterium GAS113]
MPVAVSLSVAGSDADAILALWDQASAFELTPSMRALGYAPHITLGIYEDEAVEEVRAAAAALFASQEAIRLRFKALRCFNGSPLILFAEPEPSPTLLRLHGALHRLIAPERCHPHYRPGSFIPHCTLAMQVEPDRREEAMAFVRSARLDCRVAFTEGDVVAFHPVRLISRWRLQQRARPSPAPSREKSRRVRDG